MNKLNTISTFLIGMLLIQFAAFAGNGGAFTSAERSLDRSSDYVYLKAESVIPEKITGALNNEIQHSGNEIISNGIIRLLQFKNLPGATEQDQIAASGIELIDYIPNRAWVAHIPLGMTYGKLLALGVDAIHTYPVSLRTDNFIPNENYPSYVVDGSKIRLQLVAYKFNNFEDIKIEISNKTEATILSENEEFGFIEISIEENKIQDLYSINDLRYIEIGSEEGKPENSTARTLHRSNTLNTNYLGGKKYDGSGVVVMMQDDGDIGPHIDFQGRVDQSQANNQTSQGNHGDHVAGTFMGSGNLDPLAEGMAPGVFGYIHGNSNNHYFQVPSLYNNNDLVITTKSYSNGCNAGYTTLTNQLDNQIIAHSSLLHVFSAGNSGTSNCGYGAGSNWGNVTGGHKVGKNVVTVANVSFSDQLAGSSSRGPAADGRIKPDISAKGSNVYSNDENYGYRTISGTSMACPGVTGTFAQLYHAYRDLNGGQDPNSALMKGIVLNSADDLGNPGPDFRFGWGRINGNQAYKIMANNQYMDSTIANSGLNSHTLNIPSGVARVKIMVYWKDPAATTTALFDLVSDIDMTVTDPSAGTHQPLVLDPTPSPTALNTPAAPGVDVLNNMEQVVIDAPAAGSYQIDVSGSSIPVASQEYYVIYKYEFDEVELTYPIGGEPIVPAEVTVIRWESFGASGTFTLEYSTDSGSTWNVISNTVPASQRYFNWSVPIAAITKNAMVRVSRGAFSDMSDATFPILGDPQGLQVISSCTDSAQVSWNPVTNADGYILRMLGSTYMDSVAYTTSTSAWAAPVSSNDPDVWLTAQAVYTDNNGNIRDYGRRAYAVRKQTGIYNCPQEAPVAEFSADATEVCVGRTVKFLNETINGSGNYQWTITPSTHTFVNNTSASSEEPEVQFNTDDAYTVQLEAFNPGGNSTENKADYVNPFIPSANLNEGFLSTQLPFGWEIVAAGGFSTWQVVQAPIGSNGTASNAAYFDRFNDSRINAEDELISKPVDVSGYNNPILLFDVANAMQQFVPGSISGGLRVDYSEDCGFSYQASDYVKLGEDLITVPNPEAFQWQPNLPSQWRTDTLDISGYNGNYLQFKFVNVSGILSNSLYIDNIRIEEKVNALNNGTYENSISIYPNPTNGVLNINANNLKNGQYSIAVQDLRGRQISIADVSVKNGKFLEQISLKGLESGLYIIRISGDDISLQKKISYIPNN